MDRNIKLSDRLNKVASFIPHGTFFADIGSDHAYLPCSICLQDITAQAIVGEVNEGPLQRARETVSNNHLTDRIDVRLGDGLDILQPGEVSAVVIAGMGGSLIQSILEKGKLRLKGVGRIIAQPNNDERNVRSWFSSHGYVITNEVILEENGFLYEIITGDKQVEGQTLSERQQLFGPRLLEHKSNLFRKKWERELMKRRRIIDQMQRAKAPDVSKIAIFEKESKWIKEVLEA
ncbi:tRNA (adenine(22)-N(1))-methyltransferase [Lentibacillus cibarius]|uniref:SAM-dependent methyltransferase n=1 Tax=Lentibacillus cibarius TaxID=2583219 RepID=A0A5S3QGG0_9BACI|nr:class I SAM-dependent methyltransferase [Lentibacillus cibarius]TMN20985.1 SAM-dependent methyltransferase [Lentibacillus cibarius]